MTMANLIRSLVVICTAIQLCSGTCYWSKPRCSGAAVSSSITTSATVRSSSTNSFCSLDKEKQIEYLKNKLSKPVTCDDDDSSELNDGSRELLDARDSQSIFKFKQQIKSRVLKKIYDRELKKKTLNAKSKRLLRSGVKINHKNKFISTRSLKRAVKTNYRQTSSFISNSNTVGVAGIFLNLPQGYVAKTVTTSVTNLIPEHDAYRFGLISTTSDNSGIGTYYTTSDDGNSVNTLRSTINRRYSSTNVKDGLINNNNNNGNVHVNNNVYSSQIKTDGRLQHQQRKLDIINRHAARGSATEDNKNVIHKKQMVIQNIKGQFKKPVHDNNGSNSNGDNCDDGSKENDDSKDKSGDDSSGKDGSKEKCGEDSKEQSKETSEECDGNDSKDGGKVQKAALNIRSTNTRSIYNGKTNVANTKVNQNVKYTTTKKSDDGGKSNECDDGEDEITDGGNYGVKGRINVNSKSINTQENTKQTVKVKGNARGFSKYESTHKRSTLSTRGLDDYTGGNSNSLEPCDNDDDGSGDKSDSHSCECDDDDDSGEDSSEDNSSLLYEYANTYKKFNFDIGLNAVSIIGEVLTKLDEQRYALFDDIVYPQDCTRRVYNEQCYDFIIIGAGKAGCVLANRLSENFKWKVLLVEAGGHASPVTQIPSLWQRVLNTNADWQYEIEPNTNCGLGMANTMKIHKGKCAGGGSVTSPAVYVRGSEQLYGELEKKGLTEWSFEKCVKYFRKIENIRFTTDTSTVSYGGDGLLPISKFHCSETSVLEKLISSGFDHVGCSTQKDINEKIVETGFVSLNGVIKTGRTYNAAKAYLSPAVGRENLDVMLYTRATKIIMDSTNKRAIGVEVRTKYGQTITIKANYEVLVTAGTIGSAQLLLLSGIGPENHLRKMNVPVVKDLKVGENFRHTPVFTGLVFSFDKPLMVNMTTEDIAFKYLSRNSGPLATLNGLQMAGYIKTSAKLSYADVVVHQNYVPANSFLRLCGLRAVYGFSDRVMNAYAKLNAKKDISIFTVSLVSPQSNGRIILKNRNPFEKPTVVGNTLGDQRDMDSLMNAIKIVTKFTESEAMKLVGTTLERIEIEACTAYELNSEEYWKCLVLYLVSSTSTTSGSCSMGLETDCKAVVDSHLKVIGISNLRVIGQSVLPLNINAYSQAASLMIAEKASEIIKTTYTS